MSEKRNQQWVLAARPVGDVKASDFELREVALPEPGEGEVRVRTIYLSLDPANRGWIGERETYVEPVPIGAVMRGIALGVVEESNAKGFARGDLVQGMLGWQSYYTGSPAGLSKLPPLPFPLDAAIAVLGHIGATAHFGLLEIGRPEPGETVVVSAASGAVGSLVGQIAKNHGCRVVGITSSEDKCAWLTGELGFDAAIDYRSGSLAKSLAEACPQGIDVYFDNVGGEISDVVLGAINLRARIVLCGLISMYNATKPVPGPYNYVNILTKRARVEGFIIMDYLPRFPEAAMALGKLLAEGKLKYRVETVEGLENALAAFGKLFSGDKTGKLLVKVSEEPAR